MNSVLLFFSFFFGALAPMPVGIAYNPETKECGYYQGGDEYASYILPQAWIINYGEIIQNETGSHQWDGNYDSIEQFCGELGYIYIQGNIATEYGERKTSGISTIRTICIAFPILLLLILVLSGILIAVKRHKRKKIPQKP